MNNSIRILNLLLVFVSSVCCCSLIDQLRECNITTSTLAKTDRSYVEFKDLRNNKPKKDELMRTVSWYSWKNPVFGVYGLRAKDKEGDSYYFGNVKNNDYGIFRSHSDWLNNEKPCDIKANTTIFRDNEYVKMESVMAADGRFTVYVSAKDNGFTLSCKSYSKPWQPHTIDLGYSTPIGSEKSLKKIFYDCPLQLHGH